jgi:hypothetical protein
LAQEQRKQQLLLSLLKVIFMVKELELRLVLALEQHTLLVMVKEQVKHIIEVVAMAKFMVKANKHINHYKAIANNHNYHNKYQ